MSDYQAVYDAVRSRMSNCDIDRVARDVMWQHFDFSHQKAIIVQEVCIAIENTANTLTLPSAVYRPAISIDGNQWCALYGDNLQDGIAGFGNSPSEAMAAFDKAWTEKLNTPTKGEA